MERKSIEDRLAARAAEQAAADAWRSTHAVVFLSRVDVEDVMADISMDDTTDTEADESDESTSRITLVEHSGMLDSDIAADITAQAEAEAMTAIYRGEA